MYMSKTNRSLLVDETNFVVKDMKSSDDAATKLYYLSGTPSMVTRVINLEYDKEPILLHLVLNEAYQQISARNQRQSQGQDRPIVIIDGLFEELENCLQDMAKFIESDASLNHILERIANLSYSTTRNGYYLYKKGMLTI